MLHPALAAERQALVTAFAETVRRLRELMPQVEHGGDAEALHQLRVELRRTRSALRAVAGALPVPDTAGLIEECRWLAGRGSGMRDMDVMLARLPEYLGDGFVATDPALRRLHHDVAGLRARERRALLGAFRSRRAQRLIARLEALAGLSIHQPGWASHRILAKAVAGALRKLRKHGRALVEHSPVEAWHDLRKRAKRARYLLELYRRVDAAKEFRALGDRVRRMQNAFGDYQDLETHSNVLDTLLQGIETAADPGYAALLQQLGCEINCRMPRARDRARQRLDEFLASGARRRVEKRVAPDLSSERPMIGTGGYCHGSTDGERIGLAVGKVVCVGRNFAAHAAELGNPVPEQPLLFIKPPSAVANLAPLLRVPTDAGSVHHEIEIALLIGRELSAATPGSARDAIAGIGLGIDLTLRELQDRLKAKGQPWEISKGFDGACALSPFVPLDPALDLTGLQLRLVVNGRRRQSGSSAQMLTPIIELLCFASARFTLWPGDVVLTGTPAGVGPLKPGDRITAELGGLVLQRAVVTA